mgnify:CR=1 FL=1
MTGLFASLCRIEQENSLIANIPNNLIRASSQIASIASAINPDRGLEGIFTLFRILSDYCGLVVKQHELIQKTSDQAEIGWCLGLLDAASKYVDRQVSWSLNIKDSLPDDSIPVYSDDSEE